jgi:hypothetical protein
MIPNRVFDPVKAVFKNGKIAQNGENRPPKDGYSCFCPWSTWTKRNFQSQNPKMDQIVDPSWENQRTTKVNDQPF